MLGSLIAFPLIEQHISVSIITSNFKKCSTSLLNLTSLLCHQPHPLSRFNFALSLVLQLVSYIHVFCCTLSFVIKSSSTWHPCYPINFIQLHPCFMFSLRSHSHASTSPWGSLNVTNASSWTPVSFNHWFILQFCPHHHVYSPHFNATFTLTPSFRSDLHHTFIVTFQLHHNTQFTLPLGPRPHHRAVRMRVCESEVSTTHEGHMRLNKNIRTKKTTNQLKLRLFEFSRSSDFRIFQCISKFGQSW